MKIRYPAKTDELKYSKNTKLEAYYGLPTEVKFCKKCVISNQRPNSCSEFEHTQTTHKEVIHFDENGLCDACKAAEFKNNKINWKEREQELTELCNRFRKNDGSYDCLIPGSGGKDSFYAAHILKYKYGMHPLTVTWAPHMYTPWGYHNFQAWIHAGFDNYLCTPNGLTHRLLTRLALENLFHPFQPFILGQKQMPPKLAEKFNIQLVFYGENEAEYGNPVKDNDSSLRNNKFFSTEEKDKISISGVSVRELIDVYQIERSDLEIYMPIEEQKLKDKEIEVHYLGYYLKWQPKELCDYAVENSEFKPNPERTPGTYSRYYSLDDRIDDIHFYTTFIKFGIGHASYDAAQEIRNNEITRDEGIQLVKKYDGEWPDRFETEIFSYLSIDEKYFLKESKLFEKPEIDKEYFMELANKFRSPHLWKKEEGIWKLRHTVFEEVK